MSRGPEPRLDHLAPEDARRVLLTVSNSDADDIPKVDRAGDLLERSGGVVQVMHNGLLIEEGCYYGPWMTEIIRSLRGHHEPQEEFVFHNILARLRETGSACSMIEMGSFWAYYSMWFGKTFPDGRIVAMEPDPNYLQVGKRNWALNELRAQIDFVHGAIGAEPGATLEFSAESDGLTYPVTMYDLASLMDQYKLTHVDVLLCDTQGAETTLLDRSRADLAAGKARFVIVSTHHHLISGSALTHQHTIEALTNAGAHIIVEHTVSESFSGDGLVVASFDERDRGWTIDVSRARGSESLFGGLEADLDLALRRIADVTRERDEARQQIDGAKKPAANTDRSQSWWRRLARAAFR